MQRPLAKIALVVAGASLLAGCSSDGSSLLPAALTTQSINPASPSSQIAIAPQPKVDPVCAALSARIDTLRNEGVVERAEKASVGKTQTVQVKRASLAQLAELDKANAEFQAKCSLAPRATQAQVTAAPAAPGAPIANSASVVTATAPPVVQQRQ